MFLSKPAYFLAEIWFSDKNLFSDKKQPTFEIRNEPTGCHKGALPWTRLACNIRQEFSDSRTAHTATGTGQKVNQKFVSKKEHNFLLMI